MPPHQQARAAVRAFVVSARPVDGDELIQHCRAHAASFKQPREVISVRELPENATGKILKRELRRLRP